MDHLIHIGAAANRNEFISVALDAELRRREHASIDAEFALMSKDPAYQAETVQLMREFDPADRETWEGLAKAEHDTR